MSANKQRPLQQRLNYGWPVRCAGPLEDEHLIIVEGVLIRPFLVDRAKMCPGSTSLTSAAVPEVEGNESLIADGRCSTQ